MRQALEHRIWQQLKQQPPLPAEKVLCCSGGADSIALFWILKALKISFSVVHFHHGPCLSLEQKKHRDQAARFVVDLCEKMKVSCRVFTSKVGLSSESEMRDFRREKMQHHFSKQTLFFMAHHQDDLLETRLIRLMRGTGPMGLQAMQVLKGQLCRPLLTTSGAELRDYLQRQKLEWIEDPSNRKTSYLRNWIRHRWLPLLEKKRPGSHKKLSESLESLCQVAEGDELKSQVLGTTLLLSEYWTLSSSQQIQALALLLKNKKKQSFSLSQLKEIQRRLLDNCQKSHTFKVAGVIWVINAQQIVLEG